MLQFLLSQASVMSLPGPCTPCGTSRCLTCGTRGLGAPVGDDDAFEEQNTVLIDEKMEMVKQAVREADEATKGLCVTLERHRNVAKVSDKVEGEVNEVLGDLTRLQVASMMVTHGAARGHRAENERSYLDATLKVLRSVEDGGSVKSKR